MQFTVTLITSVTQRISIFCFSLKDEAPISALFISDLTDFRHLFIAFSTILLEQKRARRSSVRSQNPTTKSAASARYFSWRKTTVFFYFISRFGQNL